MILIRIGLKKTYKIILYLFIHAWSNLNQYIQKLYEKWVSVMWIMLKLLYKFMFVTYTTVKYLKKCKTSKVRHYVRFNMTVQR